MPSVLKDWVQELTLGKQGTLATAVRGPDNVRKEHPAKVFVRAFRRSILNGAKPTTDGTFMSVLPYLPRYELVDLLGKSREWGEKQPFAALLLSFWESQVDDVPHHWLMHFAHASQIVGLHHPDVAATREFWWQVYLAIVASFHMQPEIQDSFEHRLRDRGCF